jgi:glutathione synthase/RimK-type ligase-like ATP-grasp enzyme
MGEGSWDKYGSCIIIHLNWFTLNETQIIQSIFLKNFNISSYLVQEFISDTNRGYIIKIPNKEVYKVR